MNYGRLLEEFVAEVKEEGTYASADEIREVVMKMIDIIRKNKDATPEEIVEKIIQENLAQLESLKENYPVPGYTVGMDVGNIKVKMISGYIDALGTEMPDNALFDIASMTKFYTQIIAYNLIKEGAFSLTDRVIDLDPRFENVGDLTIGDVLSFTTTFRTSERLAEKRTVEDALDCLYKMNVIQKGEYNYNDMGMMLMKELMEQVTGKSYPELVDKYIVNKLRLPDTHLIVPEEKYDLLTGSPNAKMGAVNDPSALSVGGFSGHAGVFASSDDLIRLGEGIHQDEIIPSDMVSDTYTHGVNEVRGKMGNTFTANPEGVSQSFVDTLAPQTEFAIQGSTRTQMNVSKDSVSTILLNPASMSLEQAYEEERKINEQRYASGQKPVSLVKALFFDRDNEEREYYLVDSREMLPTGKTVKPITTSNAKLALRLRFLNKVINAYDKNYDKEIKVTARI